MKKSVLLAATLALVFVTGCVVMSVYPYYTDKDIIANQDLIGKWSDPAKTNDDRETWTFEKLDAQTLKLVITENSETNQFDAHLFKLGGERFLDCFTRERAAYSSPVHLLLRVDKIAPRLEMYPLNYEWLGKLIEENPKAIRHVVVPKPAGESGGDGQLVLTADTRELQKLVLKHLKTKEAWGEEMLLNKQ